MNIKIRKPTLEELPQLLKLWRGEYEYHHKLDPVYYVDSTGREDQFTNHLTKAIESDIPNVRVAWVDNVMVGLITFEEHTEEYLDAQIKQFGVVQELFVDENYRHQGIGKALLTTAEEYFKSKGLKYVELDVSAFNARAMKLYERLGYVERIKAMYKKL